MTDKQRIEHLLGQLVGHTSEKVHKQYHGDFDYEEMSKIVNAMI